MMEKLKVTIWSEGLDAELEPRAIALYPMISIIFSCGFLKKKGSGDYCKITWTV